VPLWHYFFAAWTRHRRSATRRNFIVRIVSKLSGIELSDWSGDRESLGTFWQKQPIVLVFIRHFG